MSHLSFDKLIQSSSDCQNEGVFSNILSVNVTMKPKPDKNSRKENHRPVFQETKMKKSSVKYYVTFKFFLL